MKIAQVTEFFAPWSGGIGEHVAHLSRELRRRGHDVRILTSRFRVAGGAPVDPDLEPYTYRLGPNIRFPYNGGMASVTYRPGLPQALLAGHRALAQMPEVPWSPGRSPGAPAGVPHRF